MPVSYKKSIPGFAIVIAITSYTISLYAQSNEELISAATEPLPEYLKPGATVQTGPANGLDTIRQGDNGLICRPDNPNAPGYAVPCVHESLLPMNFRRRELMLQGMTRTEANAQINIELRNGTLSSPEIGALGNFIAGPSKAEAVLTMAFYMGDVTGAELGLPTQPSSGAWLMCSGTPQAHIMIGLPGPGDQNRSAEELCGPAVN
jgi:hypothetical protein